MMTNTAAQPSRHDIAIAVALALASAVALAATICFASLPQRAGGRPPTVGEIQMAYVRAASAAGELHDKDLKVVGVDCRPTGGRRRWCRIEFVKEAVDPKIVFLDTALLERKGDEGWTLLRGLCRGLRPPSGS